jgi:hypothetical protein
MKKICVLIVGVFFIFTACSSDDDNNQVDLSVDITGQWELTEMESEGESTVTYEGQIITVNLSGFGKDFDAQIQFTENPNEVIPTGTFTLVLTATFLGFSETDEYPVDLSSELQTGTWSIVGNQLIITDPVTAESQSAQFLVLQQNKMVLLVEMTTIVDGVEATLMSELTLER